MNKLYLLAIVVGVFGLGAGAQAATFHSGERYDLLADQVIDDDLYVAGGNANIDGTINGDLVVLAGNTKVGGAVKGSLIVVGGQVDVTGNIGGTARIAGGNVYIDGQLNRDLLVTAGNINVSGRGKINGQLIANGGQINSTGETGKIIANVGSLHLLNGAKVNGDLLYSSKSDAAVDKGAVVSGKVEKRFTNNNAQEKASNFGRALLGVATIVSLVGTILFAMLLKYLLPTHAVMMAENWRKHYGPNLVWGIVFLIVIPFVIIFLAVTVIGIPLAFILGLIYALMLMIAKLVAVIVFGSWLYALLSKDKPFVVSWASVTLGAVVMMLIGFVPVVGWLANMLIYLAALGVLTSMVWSRWHNRTTTVVS